MSLSGGSKLGPYEILSALGSGGMGEVYRARDARLDRTVAIKVLPAQVASDPDFRLRFQREDGRFLINVTTDEATASPITVILNWTAGLNE